MCDLVCTWVYGTLRYSFSEGVLRLILSVISVILFGFVVGLSNLVSFHHRNHGVCYCFLSFVFNIRVCVLLLIKMCERFCDFHTLCCYGHDIMSSLASVLCVRHNIALMSSQCKRLIGDRKNSMNLYMMAYNNNRFIYIKP